MARKYMTVNGEEGADKLDGLSDSQRKQFLRIGQLCRGPGSASSQAALSAMQDGDCGLTDEEADELRTNVAQTVDDPDQFVEDVRNLDPSTERQLYRAIIDADTETVEDIVWLTKNIDAERLSDLSQEDIDLAKHAVRVRKVVNSDIPVNRDGDVAEILAFRNVVREMVRNGRGPFKKSEEYTIYNGMTIENERGQTVTELDHVVLNSDDNVVAIFETKKGVDKAGTARSELNQALRDIRYSDSINVDRTEKDVTIDDFGSDLARYRVGPKDGTKDSELPDYKYGYQKTFDVKRDRIAEILRTIESLEEDA